MNTTAEKTDVLILGGHSGDSKELWTYANDENNGNLLEAILSLRHYRNLSIAVYDPYGNVSNIEDIFALSANIYIHKPLNLAELSRTIRQVMMMNIQFSSGNFNRETYFLSA